MKKQNLKKLNEKELREYKVPFPESFEEMSAIIKAMAERKHDYGTCVYAMSISAVAAFNYICHVLGTTGFQASMADMDILIRTRNWKWGQILDYENLLYPQNCDEEHFPSVEYLMKKNAEELKKRATELLKKKNGLVHPDVLAHWKKLAGL